MKMNTNQINWKFQGNWIKGREYDYGVDDHLYYEDCHNIILEQEFILEQLEDTLLYVGVLGYYIAHINGVRVGTAELNSDWTNYAKCVYYDEYNITNYLKVGTNKIEFELGNGMYNPAPIKLLGKYSLRKKFKEVGEVGTPRLICDITTKENTILSSNKTWTYRYGNNVFNNLYLGERVDNTYQCKKTYPVSIDEKKRNLVKSYIPKIKQYTEILPKNIINTNNGIIYDFGEIVSGFIEFSWEAIEKQEITLKYSEAMSDNKMNYYSSLVGSVGFNPAMNNRQITGGMGSPSEAIQTDVIISKTGENSFINKFTYHSFRFVLVSGITKSNIKKISAIPVHTDLQSVAEVKMDSDFFAELYNVATRTKLNNVHSTFEDCPRERLGYGGDMIALATSNLYMFDVEKLFQKVIDDFIFDQTENGGIPETAPYMGIQTNGTGDGEGPLLWQLVLPYLLYKQVQFYGNIEYVEKKFKYTKKQLDYLLEFDVEELSNYCIGDHGSLLINGDFRLPTPDKKFIGYCTILLFLKYNIKLGHILNKKMTKYEKIYQEIETVIIDKFKNNDGTFGEGTQSGLAFATILELNGGKELCKKLVDKIKADNYVFNSGIFGMMLSYEVLSKYNYNEIIEWWLLKEETPSYVGMLKRNNMVLCELFLSEHQSLNHAMFSSYQQWYFQGLAGIKISDSAIGFDNFEIEPYFSQKMNNFECTLKTKTGVIKSSWRRKEQAIEWEVTLPTNPINYQIKIPNGYTVISQKECDNSIFLSLILDRR